MWNETKRIEEKRRHNGNRSLFSRSDLPPASTRLRTSDVDTPETPSNPSSRARWCSLSQKRSWQWQRQRQAAEQRWHELIIVIIIIIIVIVITIINDLSWRFDGYIRGTTRVSRIIRNQSQQQQQQQHPSRRNGNNSLGQRAKVAAVVVAAATVTILRLLPARFPSH